MNNKFNVSEVQVSYSPVLEANYSVSSSKESFELMLSKWEHNTIEMFEEVKIILLNRSNKVIGVYALARGGITACVVDVRIILSIALRTLSTGLIIVHNHPSGSLIPSNDDKKITEQLKSACKIMGIELLDHLIISKSNYYSFADEGLL